MPRFKTGNKEFKLSLNKISNYNQQDIIVGHAMQPRAYPPGERACNSRTASTEGEMLAVTKFRTEIEWYHVRARHNALIYRPYKETANVFLVTASISPSVLAVWELHALSPPSAGRYTLDAAQ